MSDTQAALSTERFSGSPAEWDEFAVAVGGGFFHRFGWRSVLEESFGFRPHYLSARRGGRLVGVLPLCEVRSPLGRSALLSLPFAAVGGVCAVDAEARGALDDAAVELGERVGVGYVELRDGLRTEGFEAREGEYFGFRRALSSSDAEDLASIPRKRRRMIRVANSHGLTVEHGTARLDLFYDLYAGSLRRLGSPVFSFDYFRLLVETFTDGCLLTTVWSGSTPVAAVLSFLTGETVMPYYAGSRADYQDQAVNDFMYWELMRAARARGFRLFDFGRSKLGSGAFAYKQHWGFSPEPMVYRVRAIGTARPTLETSDAGRLRWIRRAWSRIPLPVTKLLGPPLVRRFGAFYT